MATYPRRASRPSRNEYAGSSDALRRITLRLRVDSTAVTECGYMNSASADPSASVAYAQYTASPGTTARIGAPSSSLPAATFSFAAPKISSQPPRWIGR